MTTHRRLELIVETHYRAALDGEERTVEFARNGRSFEATVTPVHEEAVGGGVAVVQLPDQAASTASRIAS